jgi:hypothetical protein
MYVVLTNTTVYSSIMVSKDANIYMPLHENFKGTYIYMAIFYLKGNSSQYGHSSIYEDT